MTGTATGPAMVCLIDDDESVHEALPDLLREFGFASRAFASAEQVLASDALSLVLDVAMPGMTGPQLHVEPKRRAMLIPLVFVTAHSDESLFGRPLAECAVACPHKPFSDAALFDALKAALASK